MFKEFKINYNSYSVIENQLIEIKGIPFKYKELLLEFGGNSFDKGLYTIYTFTDSIKWTNLLCNYFEKFKDEIICFGHDWMGRQFCVPTKSNECILVFDPATQEDFFIEDNLLAFHNNILANDKGIFFAMDLFELALNFLKITGINYNQCIGFKTPLFLNGKEEVSNYEVCDLEVYWDLQYQLYQQVKNLQDGIRIQGITVNPFPNK
jgi:hypothetical protein